MNKELFISKSEFTGLKTDVNTTIQKEIDKKLEVWSDRIEENIQDYIHGKVSSGQDAYMSHLTAVDTRLKEQDHLLRSDLTNMDVKLNKLQTDMKGKKQVLEYIQEKLQKVLPPENDALVLLSTFRENFDRLADNQPQNNESLQNRLGRLEGKMQDDYLLRSDLQHAIGILTGDIKLPTNINISSYLANL